MNTIRYTAVGDDGSHIDGTWTGRRAEALETGRASLGATLDDDGGSYRYHATETGYDYVVSSEAVESLGAALLSGYSIAAAYSVWCAGSMAAKRNPRKT